MKTFIETLNEVLSEEGIEATDIVNEVEIYTKDSKYQIVPENTYDEEINGIQACSFEYDGETFYIVKL